MDMVTRTFVKSTMINFKEVRKGEIGPEQTIVIEGGVSDPIKTAMKHAGLGKLDSVIIISVVDDSEILGVPVDQFKAIAVPVIRNKVEE